MNRCLWTICRRGGALAACFVLIPHHSWGSPEATTAPAASLTPIFTPPADEPLPQTTPGPFGPSWQSLSKYQCPDWFRDAKFGIWAHWDPEDLIDGRGLWWQGLDPADLYGPAGAARAPAAKGRYDRKFYNRVIQLIDDYQPHMIYFDDSRMPISDEIGLSADIRFTTHDNVLYAMTMVWPADGRVTIKSLAEASDNYPGTIGTVELLGSLTAVKWERGKDGLVIRGPTQPPCAGPCVLKISPKT